MSAPILSHNSENTNTTFTTIIEVAGAMVSPNAAGDVELDHGDEGGIHVFTPAEACALAAALQAVGVYQMEQQPREVTRRTAPGQPATEELNGAGL